jgi:hypothetical protein
MIKPARDIIYGVCDKTGDCDSYFGFFKNYEDAQKEIKIQSDRLKEDLGLMDIVVKKDRSVIMRTDRVEELVIVIHEYVLR